MAVSHSSGKIHVSKLHGNHLQYPHSATKLGVLAVCLAAADSQQGWGCNSCVQKACAM